MTDYTDLEDATVCICAPARAAAQVKVLERRLGLAGAIVLAPVPAEMGEDLDAARRERVSFLHRRRINMAEAVVVVSADGYVGDGTGREIAHALRRGKQIRFAEEPARLVLDAGGYRGLLARDKTVEIRPARQVAQLSSGMLLALVEGDGSGRCAWCRVVEVERYTDRHALVDAVDPGRVRRGLERAGLLAGLDAAYPQDDDAEQEGFAAIVLDLLGERGPDREQAAAAEGSRPRTASGAGLLMRDGAGRILLVEQTALPGGWRLPARPVFPGEHPRDAAERAAAGLLGVPLPSAGDLLVVDHLPDDSAIEAEHEYVFDGGAIADEHAQHLVAVSGERSVARFADPGQLPGLLAPRLARRTSAALARLADPAAPVMLEHGYAPGDGPPDWVWVDADLPPTHLPFTHVSVWAFDPDGRVLVQHRVDQCRFALPGGRREEIDRDPVATAAREAWEESQVVIDQARAVVIGYQITHREPGFPDGMAQVRVVAPILEYLPIGPDTDPELGAARAPYRRYLAEIWRAAELLDYGMAGIEQAGSAARVAREVLGIPVDRPAADGYRDHHEGAAPNSAAAETEHP